MNRSPNRKLRITAILLILGVPLSIVAAAVYSMKLPRLFGAATEIQLMYPADASRVGGSLTGKRCSSSPIVGTSISRAILAWSRCRHRISTRTTAMDVSPQVAMDTANTLSIFIHNYLREASNEEGRRMTILKSCRDRQGAFIARRTRHHAHWSRGRAGLWCAWCRTPCVRKSTQRSHYAQVVEPRFVGMICETSIEVTADLERTQNARSPFARRPGVAVMD